MCRLALAATALLALPLGAPAHAEWDPDDDRNLGDDGDYAPPEPAVLMGTGAAIAGVSVILIGAGALHATEDAVEHQADDFRTIVDADQPEPEPVSAHPTLILGGLGMVTGAVIFGVGAYRNAAEDEDASADALSMGPLHDLRVAGHPSGIIVSGRF